MPSPATTWTAARRRCTLKADGLRVVLVEIAGTANLGMIARSLACFGVTDWWLVRPHALPEHETAHAWACHGAPWLSRVQQVDRLQDALVGVDVALGLTGHSGKRRHRTITPARVATEVFPRYQLGKAALVFGNEESGLNGEDLRLCHWLVKVPTDPAHMSLNLAHTVTLMLHELVGREATTELGGKPLKLAPPALLQRALGEFADFLWQRGYPGHESRLEEEMRKSAELLHRARPEVWEVNYMLGMLRHLRNHERGRIPDNPPEGP